MFCALNLTPSTDVTELLVMSTFIFPNAYELATPTFAIGVPLLNKLELPSISV